MALAWTTTRLVRTRKRRLGVPAGQYVLLRTEIVDDAVTFDAHEE
jgi:hypothetical protein